MIVAWVHSMRFMRRDGAVYGEAMLPYEVWQRYLRHFQSLVVVGRGPEQNAAFHDKYLKQASGPSVRFELLDSLNTPKDLLLNSNAIRSELRRILSGADGVIARLPSEHGLAAVAVARELRKPYAIELVGCAFDALWNHGTWQGKVYAPIMAWRVRQAVRSAPYVLYVTREFLQKRYPADRVRTNISNAEIPASVAAISDVELPEESPTRLGDEEIAEPGSRPVKPFNIGLIGSFQNAYKGHETALRAIAHAKGQAVGARLRLVGVGDPSKWQEMASKLGIPDRVAFDGVVSPGAPIFRWLKNLDLYIQPSLTEGLPRALIEAMACERAALASSAGGMPELLSPECLHRPGDWRALAAKIIKAANDPFWLAQQAARNKRIALTYSAPVLDAKRIEFWSAFARGCGEQLPTAAA